MKKTNNPVPQPASGSESSPSCDASRRHFIGCATAASLAATTNLASSVEAQETAKPASDPYKVYESATANDAAYAKFVSSAQVDVLKELAFLNVHYGERENGRVQDMYSKKWYWDCHRNGSKYNLGHQNPKLVAALAEGVQSINAGSFSQLSGFRAKLAEKLVATTDGALNGVTFGCSGGESNEIAIHAARNHTNRTKLVAISTVSYHGSTDLGLSISGISAVYRKRYRVPTTNTTFVPFNDLKAMQAAVTDETAAVVLEPTPAQGGFPAISEGYLEGVRAVCDDKGAVLILDEVQTGMGGTGKMWAYQHHDLVPDILTTGKGFGGGFYPISAAIMKKEVWRSYTEDQFIPHESTYAGAEIGCAVALKVLEITNDADFLLRVRTLADRFTKGFTGLPIEVTQHGLCMGLRTPDPIALCSKLAACGVLTVPSFDDDVVPFRPVLTLSDQDADAIIESVQKALK